VVLILQVIVLQGTGGKTFSSGCFSNTTLSNNNYSPNNCSGLTYHSYKNLGYKDDFSASDDDISTKNHDYLFL
jgi:hypothetical protein